LDITDGEQGGLGQMEIKNDLMEYLNKYFLGSTEGLQEHFLEKFGVQARQEGDLWQFKYKQFEAKFSFPLTHFCRGIILEKTDISWHLVSYPFKKFFNPHESFCWVDWSLMPETFMNFSLIEKVDGTCIQLYFYKDQWRVSTLGQINTTPVDNKDFTFEELFWTVLKNTYGYSKEKFYPKLASNYTYIFELCSNKNQIITLYPENRIYLVGVRKLFQDQRLYTYGELEIINQDLKIHLPGYFTLAELGLTSLSDILEYAEIDSEVETSKIVNKEGFVLYHKFQQPVAKIKNSRYLLAHSIFSHNENFIIKKIILLFFAETLDDYYSLIPEKYLPIIDKLKEKVSAVTINLRSLAKDIHQRGPSTNKDFALLVQQFVLVEWQFAFYQQRENILKGQIDVFDCVMKETAEKKLDFWRAQLDSK